MKKKIIAINALSALQGGGQVYLSNILRYADKFHDIKICIFASLQFASLYSFPGIEVITVNFTSKNLLARMLWEKWQLPKLLRQLQIDLVFCPGGSINFLPPPGCLTAVTFQNMLIFDVANQRKYPFGYMRLRLKLLQRIAKNSFEKADLVLFLSQYAKTVVDQKVPRRKGLSEVIPHGLDVLFRTATTKDTPRLKSLPKDDYLLYVSVVDAFKAQVEIVRAYHLFCQGRNTKEKLLFIGPEYPPYAKLVRKEIQRLGLNNKVLIMGEIPYADMPSVYHHAKAHIFASHCENCPNVVIETLGSGRPLYLSNKPPMPEIAGDAAVYFDPCKPEQLAGLLLRYIDDKQWAEKMGKKVFERSLFYNWEATAKKTFQAFEELLAANEIKDSSHVCE